MNIDDSRFKVPGRSMSLAVALAAAGLLCSMSAPVLSQESSRGQALYENHCRTCHESSAHTRDGRKVTSMTELRSRVAAWSIHAGLDWSEQEVDDVTDYLNRTFYQFESTP